jgi:hypothetical protein
LYASQGTFDDILKFLMKHGFSLVDLEMHEAGWGDALFTSSIDNLTKPVVAQHYDPNRPT